MLKDLWLKPVLVLFYLKSILKVRSLLRCVSQETVTEDEQHASVYIKYGEDYQDKMIGKYKMRDLSHKF